MTDSPFVEQADPDEVFSLLSNNTRVEILRALWEADDHEATFSELRQAVGMRDSGQFNYHLNELVGRFISSTEGGYELMQAGMRINGAIEAGAYTAEGLIDPIALTEPCPPCGGDRTLRYEDETVRVECDSCPVGIRIGVPPAVFAGYDREAIPRVASQYLQTTAYHITNGFCSFCDGPVTPTVGPAVAIDTDEDVSAEDSDRDTAHRGAEWLENIPLIQYTCHQCGAEPTFGLTQALIHHPAVVSFYHNRGIDVRDHSMLDFTGGDPDHQAVQSRNPFRGSVTYECDGDALTLTVDETLTVVETER